MSWTGKAIAVIGATGGAGGAVARKLIREGARVHVVGRDVSKLDELMDLGARQSYVVDLGRQGSVGALMLALPELDGMFVLSGTAVVGMQSTEDLLRFEEVNYGAPTRLIDGLLARGGFRNGAVIGVVTSASAAMGPIKALEDYQRVKLKMAKWAAGKMQDSMVDRRGYKFMLISMGAVKTGIWDDMPWLARKLADAAGWSSERAADVILADAMDDMKNVSYPGAGAALAPYRNGVYRPNPLVKLVMTEMARLSVADVETY